MIYSSLTVTVSGGQSKINERILLYRGDREIQVSFEIIQSAFKFAKGENVIDTREASTAQLIIDKPDGTHVFSEITQCEEGKVVFTITAEMIDELKETGLYTLQIRLFDETSKSRITLPPIENAIEVREPIAAEDETNIVDIALVDYSVVKDDPFEDLITILPNGDYNKTDWETGDIISRPKLNKIEDALYVINRNMDDLDMSMLNQLETINRNVNDLDLRMTNQGETTNIQLKDVSEQMQTKASMNTVISNLRNTEGFINEILKVCQTYTDNFDKLVYGNRYTAWDETVQMVDGKFELDCSSFINLLIHGVTFHKSRYNGNNDNHVNPLFFNKMDSYEYRLANQMAKYCVENGYAFVPSSLDEIRAGDIVFYSWDDFRTNPEQYTQAQIDFHNNAFMQIDHVAMYLDRQNESYHHTIQYEQYTPQFLFTVEERYMQQAVLVARLPFANIQNNTEDMIVNGNTRKDCIDSIEIGTYYLSKQLEKGKIYTLAINGRINTYGCYFIVQDEEENTLYSDYGARNLFEGTKLAYFLYQGEGVDKITLKIGCNDATNLIRNGSVFWCSLHEGYKITVTDKQGSSNSNIRELPLNSGITNILLNDYAFTNNLIEYDSYYVFNLNLSVNNDYITNEIVISTIDPISKSQRIPCILINHAGEVAGGAVQFRDTGEVRIIKYNSDATWRHAIASGIVIK